MSLSIPGIMPTVESDKWRGEMPRRSLLVIRSMAAKVLSGLENGSPMPMKIIESIGRSFFLK